MANIFGSLIPPGMEGVGTDDLNTYANQLAQGDQYVHQLIPAQPGAGVPAPFSMGGPAPAETAPAAAPRLIPALRTPGGDVLTHPDAVTHADVATAWNFFPTSRDDSGFVPEGGGPYMDRRTAGDYLAVYHPDINANLKKSGPAQPWGKLEARDLSRATDAADAGVHLPTTDADAFHAAIGNAKAENPYGAAVYQYPADEYKNMNLWLSGDKKSGFAIKPDGDLVSVFSTQKGRLPSIMDTALSNGATKLDAFDTGLAQMYGKYGFSEVNRVPWNDEYAPPDWPAQLGKPDVVYMQHPNGVSASPPIGMLSDQGAPPPVSPAAPLSLARTLKRDTGTTLKSLALSPQELTAANRMLESGMNGEDIVTQLGSRLSSIKRKEPLNYPIPFGFDPPQTIYNPVGNENPAIYGNPREIAATAAQKVAPESPWLKRLFGVTRDDLYGIGQQGTRQGNIDPVFNASAGTSPQAQKVMTPWNAQRLVDTLSEAGKYPDLIKGMDSWYVMDPAYERLAQLVGPEQAKAEYNQLNTFGGMASPGSPVDWEINRGAAARYLHNQGRFDEFPIWGSMAVADRPRNGLFPQDLKDLIPHIYTNTAHAPAMLKYIQGGKVDMDSAKVPLYIQASGVPETGFQTTMPVGDAHFTKSIGLPDVRTAIKTKNSSMKSGPYTPIGHWYRENVANPLGIQAVPAQARQWGTFAHLTGVDTAIGAPKLELMAHRIGETAMRRGVSPEWLRDQVLLGKAFP